MISLEKLGKANESSITISSSNLHSSKTLEINSTVVGAYNEKIKSKPLRLKVPFSGKQFGGPCKFKDEQRCIQLNGVCWENYLNFDIKGSLNTTDCLRAVAPLCYSIWKQTNDSDPQCLDFKELLNFTAMKIKPVLTRAYYSSNGKKIILEFDQPMRRKDLVNCQMMFDKATLNWLPSSGSCTWVSSTVLEADYDPQAGIMEEIGLKEKVFYYIYAYSQEATDPVKMEIQMPDAKIELKIQGPEVASACENVNLYGMLVVPVLFPVVFKWEISYNPPLVEPLATEAATYFAPYKEYSNTRSIMIPSTYLAEGAKITITLESKAESFDSAVSNTSTIVTVYKSLPSIKFATKAQFVLELEGDKVTNMPLQIDSNKCGTSAEKSAVNISFSVLSGDTAEVVLTHGESEANIEKVINEGYVKYKALLVGTSKGFKYYKHYRITAMVENGGGSNTDTVLIFFTKPPIKSVISSPGTLISLSKDIYLSGKNSEFPALENDKKEYLWQCLKAAPMAGGTCECPILSYTDLKNEELRIPSDKLKDLCKYTFALSVSAKYFDYKRAAYNETEFVAFAGATVELEGKVTKGNNKELKDMYLTLVTKSEDKPANESYEWSLTEIESVNPKENRKYSVKNTFIFNFFKKELNTQLDSSITKDDIPLPTKNRRLLEEVEPPYLTPTISRTLGVDQSGLLPLHKYTFGVVLHSTTTPSFLFLTFVQPPAIQPRKLEIYPTTGIGFETEFTFTFTLPSSTDVDNAEYQIYRRNCPSTNATLAPLTQVLSKSNTYATILSPGLKACNHEVQIVLKIFEYGNELEVSSNITVQEPQTPLHEALASQLNNLENNPDLSVDQKISLLSEIANVEITESTDNSKNIANTIFKQIETIDQPGGILESMNDQDKAKLLDTTASIMSNMATTQKEVIDLQLASSMASKVDSYLTEVKTAEGGLYIIPTSLALLSGIANIGTEQQSETEFFAAMQEAMNKMADLVLNKMTVGSLPYKLTSPAIEMVLEKDYSSGYNQSKNFSTPKGSAIKLPGELTDQMLKSINTTVDGDVTFGSSIFATTFNPFANIKTNTKISVGSLTNSSTQGVEPGIVERIYTDLSVGKFKDLVNTKEQDVDLIQLAFRPYKLEKNLSETPIDSTVNIGKLPEGTEAIFSIVTPKSVSGFFNTSTMVPLYYLPVDEIWTNENCSLDDPGIDDYMLTLRCKQAGPPQIMSAKDAYSVTVDLIKDVMNVIRAGNYEQLISVSSLMSLSTRNITAYITVAAILTLVIMAEILLHKADRHGLYKCRLKYLLDKFEPKEKPEANGILNQVFAFYSQAEKKGMNNMAKMSQGAEAVPTKTDGTKQPKEVKKANGFCFLSKDDKDELADSYHLYKQCSLAYEEKGVENAIADELEQGKVLNRLTQTSIDDALVSEPVTFWLLMKTEHPILDAFLKPEITTPRHVKFLLVATVLIGEFFLTGYFHDTEEDQSISDDYFAFIADAIVYSLAAVVLMIPLKLIESIFLTGKGLTEEMTREDIESLERATPTVRKVGIAFGYLWIVACLYGIMMYMINFSQSAMEDWLITFGISFFFEIVVMSQLEVFFTVLVGLLLMKLAQAEIMMSAAGVIAGYILDWLLWLF